MGNRLMRWLAGCSVAAVALAGCAEEPEPAPSPSPSPTEAETSESTTDPEPAASAEPGPGPTPWPEPTRPPAMERDDIEGAKAAAEYFLELYPYAFATGDLEAWDGMSHPDCEFCRGTADHVRELFSEGGYALGGSINIDQIGASEPDDTWSHYRVGVRASEEPSVEYSPSGDIVAEFDGGTIEYNFAMIADAAGWLVRGVAVVEGS